MAAIKIDMMLQDSTGSIDKRTRSTKELNRELTKAQQLGKQGVGSGDVVEYGRSRAVGAGTGASARDFANQAQGLGGLVRVYATFAANLFAVQAAFTALSNAMDTSNMVRGLDQLGAASGQNLGTLSKRLAEASDGAVTLRAAMEATAKASSSGLSSTQILELGKAAKNASVALGVDMGDALSRLSRGISKLEPELLDELGIYVKIDDAVQKYALSVGKAASSLTDYERRQAFAVAALDQARQKFGEIDIDVNPFTRLAATFRNTAQSILESINSILGPIAGLLADSTGVIAGLIGLITLKLLKQAIPAFGEWRDSVIDATKRAKDIATKNISELDEKFVMNWEARLNIPKLKDSIKTTNQELKSISVPKELARNKIFQKIQGPNYTAEKQDITKLTTLITNRQKAIDKLKENESNQSKARISQLQFQQQQIQKTIDLVNLQIAVQDRLNNSYEIIQGKTDQPATATERANLRQLQNMERTINRAEAISAAVQDAGSFGFRAGLDQLKKQIEEKGIKGFDKLRTKVAGTFSVGMATASRFIGALGQIGFVVGAVIGGFQLLNSWLGKNNKELEEASTAIQYLEDSGKNLERTLARINKIDPLERVSVANIAARSAAINDLTSNITSSFEKIKNALDASNWWDNFIDRIKGIFGQDIISVGARNLSVQLAAALNGALEGPEKEKFKKDLAQIFKTEDVSKWAEILGKSPEAFVQLMPMAEKALKQFNTETQNNTSRLKESVDKIKELTNSYDKFLISAIPTDPVAQLGIKFIEVSDMISSAVSDINNEVSLLAEISKDPKILRFLTLENQRDFAVSSEGIKENIRNIQNYKETISDLQKQITEKENYLYKVLNPKGKGEALPPNMRLEINERITAELDPMYNSLYLFKEALREEERKQEQNRAKLSKVYIDANKKGAELIESSIAKGFEKAKLTLREAFNITAQGTEAGTRESFDIQRRSLDLEIESLQAQLTLIDIDSKTNTLLEEISINTRLMTETDPEKRKSLELQRQERDSIVRAVAEGTYSNENNDSNSNNPLVRDFLKRLQTTGFSTAALQGKISGLKAQRAGLDIRERVEVGKLDLQTQKELNDQEIKRQNIFRESLDLNLRYLDYQSESLMLAAQESSDTAFSLAQKNQIADINERIKQQEQTVVDSIGTASEATAKKALAQLKVQYALIDESQQLDKQAQSRAAIEKQLTNEQKLLTFRNMLLEHSYKLEQNRQKVQEARLGVLKSTGGISETDAAELETRQKLASIETTRTKELQVQENTYDSSLKQAREALQFELAGNITAEQKALATKVYLARVTQIYDTLQRSNELTESEAATQTELARLAGIQALEQGKYNDKVKELNNQETLRSLQQANLSSELESQKTDLQIQLDLGQISLDNYNIQIFALEKMSRVNEYNNKLKASELNLTTALMEIERDRKIIMQDEGGLTPESEARLKARETQAREVYRLETEGASKAYFAQNRQAESTKKLTERQQGYFEVVQKGFDSLTDAIVQFARTGEFSWKEMLKNMAADMLRFELQMHQRQLMGAFRNFLLVGSSSGNLNPQFYQDFSLANPGYGAKGAYFDGMSSNWSNDALKFAKGGMFTNSIVDQPTTFKFAKGVGVMGEAGPEAIMPLKRDSSGNLGVRAQGGNTQVVVNNYSSEKAEARETVDSRGNRKIEVVVGDMVAGEVSRGGSSSNKAMKNTFGLKPQLIRR